MYPHIFGLVVLQSIKPYFRKHVLLALTSHEYLLVSTVLFCIFSMIYFGFLFFYKNISVVHDTFKKIKTLTHTQLGAVFILSFIAVLATELVLDLDKNYNTPAFNYVVVKALGFVVLLELYFSMNPTPANMS